MMKYKSNTREYKREWYKRHPGYLKDYYNKHPKAKEKKREYAKKYNKTWKLNNPEYQKKWRSKNIDKCRAYSIRSARKALLRIVNYKLNIGCQICGYKKCSYALDFHHKIGSKEFSVSSYFTRKWETILKEIEKCIVVCRNCHAEIHYKLRNRKI